MTLHVGLVEFIIKEIYYCNVFSTYGFRVLTDYCLITSLFMPPENIFIGHKKGTTGKNELNEISFQRVFPNNNSLGSALCGKLYFIFDLTWFC